MPILFSCNLELLEVLLNNYLRTYTNYIFGLFSQEIITLDDVPYMLLLLWSWGIAPKHRCARIITSKILHVMNFPCAHLYILEYVHSFEKGKVSLPAKWPIEKLIGDSCSFVVIIFHTIMECRVSFDLYLKLIMDNWPIFLLQACLDILSKKVFSL